MALTTDQLGLVCMMIWTAGDGHWIILHYREVLKAGMFSNKWTRMDRVCVCTCHIIREHGVKPFATIDILLFAMMVRNAVGLLKNWIKIFMIPWYFTNLNYFPTGRVNASASYVMVYEYKTWTEAQSYCREHHTDLISIRNEIENYRVQSLIQYSVAWIGLYRTRSWSDQSNSSFSNWTTGQPDNAGNSEYCTAVSFSDSGSWTDENCNTVIPFICYSGE